jgi:hypothetical protein
MRQNSGIASGAGARRAVSSMIDQYHDDPSPFIRQKRTNPLVGIELFMAQFQPMAAEMKRFTAD